MGVFDVKLKLSDFRALCLAGALILPTGAWAADAVVATDPEPQDSVKVCDAYGNGYFYIPGTETCLRIRGIVRYEKEIFNYSGHAAKVKQTIDDFVEGQLEVYARNDSEYGMVYSWVKLDNIASVFGSHKINADHNRSWTLAEKSTNDNRFLFGIGNFQAGLNNSQFTSFFGDGGATDWAGHYINLDYKVRQQVSYSFYDDYLSAIISLESGSKPHRAIPDVVAAAKYDFGDYEVSGGFGYDKPDNSFAWTGRFDAQVKDFRFILQAFYSNNVNNTYFDYDGLSVLGGASVKVTDKISLASDLQFWDNGDWLGIADASFSPVQGFRLLGEVSASKVERVKSNSLMFRVERSF